MGDPQPLELQSEQAGASDGEPTKKQAAQVAGAGASGAGAKAAAVRGTKQPEVSFTSISINNSTYEKVRPILMQ